MSLTPEQIAFETANLEAQYKAVQACDMEATMAFFKGELTSPLAAGLDPRLMLYPLLHQMPPSRTELEYTRAHTPFKPTLR